MDALPCCALLKTLLQRVYGILGIPQLLHLFHPVLFPSLVH